MLTHKFFPSIGLLLILFLFGQCKSSEQTISSSEEEIAIDKDEDYSSEGPSEESTRSSAIIVSGDMEVASESSSRKVLTREPSGTSNIKPKIDIKPQPGLITAAEWNDLYNWDDWKQLMDDQDYNEMQSHWGLYPRSRYSVFIRNKYELPLQDVPVELLTKSGQVLWSSRTDNAGRAELWADMTVADKSFDLVDVRVTIAGRSELFEDVKSIEEGVNHFDFDLECIGAPHVDVLFAVDATGSMSDEIKYLQMELKDVISRSMISNTNLQLRTGAVFYRDSTDAYVTRVSPLTNDHDATLNFIGAQRADGGGDYPEAVDAAMEEALAQDWSENAVARIIFLLLDAPPHYDETILSRIKNQVADAAEQGIKIIPITASGINRQTEFLMKFFAIATNGTYVFITDHSGIGNPHLDPIVQDYEVEKLNDLLVRLLYNYTKSNGCDANDPSASTIALFPNPTSNFVNINTEQPIRTLKVLSNSGKLITTHSGLEKGSTKIDLTGLVDGVYTIHCLGDNLDYAGSVVVVNN